MPDGTSGSWSLFPGNRQVFITGRKTGPADIPGMRRACIIYRSPVPWRSVPWRAPGPESGYWTFARRRAARPQGWQPPWKAGACWRPMRSIPRGPGSCLRMLKGWGYAMPWCSMRSRAGWQNTFRCSQLEPRKCTALRAAAAGDSGAGGHHAGGRGNPGLFHVHVCPGGG